MKKASKIRKKFANYAKKHPRRSKAIPIVLIAVLGIATILISQAATFSVSLEPELASSKTGVTTPSDATASGNSYVRFGTGSVAGGTWPSGWDDPIFANVTPRSPSVTGFNNTTVQDIEIIGPTTGKVSTMGCRNFTARRVRIRGVEGIRVCGSNVLVEDFYLEITGAPAPDYGDGIQYFESFNNTSPMLNTVFRRGHIRLRGNSNSGIFLADSSMGHITLEHMLVDTVGAPNDSIAMFNVPGDQGVQSVSFSDVVVTEGIRFIDTNNIDVVKWENVRYTDGRQIPPPN